MKTMEDLRRRIENVRDVQSTVATMKSLAAAQVRQYESAANATTEYLRTVEMGFHVLQRDQPIQALATQRAVSGIAKHECAAVVFGSDQGLCGKFNEDIVDYAVSEMSTVSKDWKLVVVGKRAASLLASVAESRDSMTLERVLAVPVNVQEIARVMQRLMPVVSQCQQQGAEFIDVYFNIRQPANRYAPQTFRLFPISQSFLQRCRNLEWDSKRLPIFKMKRASLITAIVRQYLFVGLYRACAESRASENTSRIVAMQTASSNIERRLQELTTEFHQSRQAAITEEILDIVAGVEALAD